MAETFEDVVKKLGSTVKKPAGGKAENVLAVQMVDSTGKPIEDDDSAAATEEKREREKREQESLKHLKSIAEKLVGKAKTGAKDIEKSGIFSKIGGIFGGLGLAGLGAAAPPIIAALGGSLIIMGKGLAFFITAVGGAFALQALIFSQISKTFPSLIKNLRGFEKIDGKKITEVGKGLTQLALGLAAGGVGGAISGIGGLVEGIADGIGKLFGIETGQDQLFKKLEKFGEVKLNAENIKNNAAAMVAYGGAMSAAGAGKTINAIAAFADGVFGGLGRMLGSVPPLAALKKFGETDVNAAQVTKNATAMIAYGKALSIGSGAKVLGSVATAFSGILDSVGKLFGAVPPLESLKAFGKEKVNLENVENNAKAMIAYTGALSMGAVGEMAGAISSVGTVAKAFFDGFSKMLGGQGTVASQLDGLMKFGEKAVNLENVENNAKAMVSFTGAMALGAVGEASKGIASVGTFAKNAFDGLSKMIGGGGTLKSQLDGLTQFSNLKGIDVANVEKNASAMVAYTKAMALGAAAAGGDALKSLGDFVSGAIKSLGHFIGISTDKNPLQGLINFSNLQGIDLKNVKNNADAMVAYATAMAAGGGAKAAEGIGDFISGVFGSIGKLFSGAADSPSNAVVKFSKLDINLKKLQNNIKALKEFNSLGFTQVGRTGGLTSFANDLARSVPIIEAAIMGGQVFDKTGIGTGDYITKGLASTEIKYGNAIKNIRMLRKALGAEVVVQPPTGTVPREIDEASFNRRQGPGGGGTNTFNTGGNVLNAPTTNYSIDGTAARRPVQLNPGGQVM